MILDGKDIGLGEVVISTSQAEINSENISINQIDIYDKSHKFKFTFWTQQEYEKFNDLKLNEKTDVMNLIDDYDIDFGTSEYETINSRENSCIYFTKLDTNKYIVNAEINDFDKCIIGSTNKHKNLELEAIIDFNKIKK